MNKWLPKNIYSVFFRLAVSYLAYTNLIRPTKRDVTVQDPLHHQPIATALRGVSPVDGRSSPPADGQFLRKG